MEERAYTPSAYYSENTERAVLAGFCNSAETLGLVAEVSEDDFTIEGIRKVFRAIKLLAAERVKAVTFEMLDEKLTELYGADEAMMLNIATIRVVTGQPAVVRLRSTCASHIKRLKQMRSRRAMRAKLERALTQLDEGTGEFEALVEETRAGIVELQTETDKSEWVSYSDAVMSTFDVIERRSKGEEPFITTGLKDLDKMTAGLHRGEFTIIGARPAVGKSAFAMNIANEVARQGYKVAVVSREMTDTQYVQRAMTHYAAVDGQKLRTGKGLTGEDWENLSTAMCEMGELPIRFSFKTRYVEDLRTAVEAMVEKGEIDVLIVDYIQLMQTREKFDAEYLRLAYVSKMLKDLTIDYNIVVIGLAQVGRSAQGTMPTMSELRGSGDLEQDADNILFLHRVEDADDRHMDKRDESWIIQCQQTGQQYIAINIAKQRSGSTGECHCIFNPARMTYYGISRDESST